MSFRLNCKSSDQDRWLTLAEHDGKTRQEWIIDVLNTVADLYPIESELMFSRLQRLEDIVNKNIHYHQVKHGDKWDLLLNKRDNLE